MRRPNMIWVFTVLFLVASLAAASAEGYDPLRIISAQIARPSIYIVMDVSGSMAWDIYGSTDPINLGQVGVDCTGTWPTAAWNVVGSGTSSSGKYKIYNATLTVSQKLPSRMATVKNAMGNSVDIITQWEPPDSAAYPAAADFPAAWRAGTITGPTYTFSAGTSGTSWYTTWKWVWKVTYTVYKSNPGAPFTCVQTIGTNASAPKYNGTYPTELPAADLLGQTAESVNWGLYTYGGSTFTLQVPIDTNDTGNVTAIQNKMKLNSASGLGASGGTPTRTALGNIKGAIQNTFDGDPKYNCGRTYGVILMTDGLSNTGNPNGGNWIKPCGACPGLTCCDGGTSGYNCPDSYTLFAAGESEDLWTMSRARGGITYRLPVRTWVIGVSDKVSPCELNYTAYMGRTDASSPYGDAGFALDGTFPFATGVKPLDPYLPQSTGDTGHHNLNPAHPNYAYFATSAGALKAAFEAILAGLGPGDYTTSQPIVSSTTGNAGYVSLLASSEYPGWKGHLYADSLTEETNCDLNICSNANPSCDDCVCATCPGNIAPIGLWDAGAKLQARDPATRAIFTWNTSNDLVAVTTANAAALNTICGNCGITAAVVDYIRGTGRTAKLGAVLNSTPTIVAGPIEWKADQVPTHTVFEADYGSRHPLVYAGASDGMLHAFDAVDGYEILALVTPDNLAEQVTFYNNYLTSSTRYPTGEPGLPQNHIWGVANSPRIQDVYFGPPDSAYKTMLFLTQGPSSKMVAGIDISHPYPGRTGVLKPDRTTQDYLPDYNYDPDAPVEVIWTKSNANYPGLQFTWSIPAVAATRISTSNPDFEANIGSGWNASSTSAAQVVPTFYSLDATDGSPNNTDPLGNLTSPYVGNQAFADSVMFTYTARIYQEGTAQNVAIQADLNGQIWFLNRPSGSNANVIFNATGHAGQSQPIYYSPAVAGFKSRMCLAFSSGSYFEKDTDVNGATAAFRARLYLIGKAQDDSVVAPAQVRSWRITDLDNTVGATLSDQATVVAPALLLVPTTDSGEAIALFPIYDPASGDCAGTSYVVKIIFDPTNLPGAVVTSYFIGSGAISGFAVAGNVIVVAKSGVGAGKRATAPVVPGVTVGGSDNGMRPIWWRELQ